MIRQALILAAGEGRRLASATGGGAKCLARIDGRPLLQLHLEVLASVGIERVCIVIGSEAERVRAVAGSGCDFVMNDVYAETNSLYSLHLARERMDGGFLMMNADVLAPRVLFERLISMGRSALAYDSSSGDQDEHMKVDVRDGRLVGLSKTMPAAQAAGESVGIMCFDAPTAERVLASASALVEGGARRTWAPAAVDAIVPEVPVAGVDVADLPWVEIDFPEDLEEARRRVWPAIRGHADRCMRSASNESRKENVA